MSASRQRGRLPFRAGLVVLLAGLGAAGAWLWWTGNSAADAIRIELAEADLERGAELYAEHCASCHGADLQGQPDWRSPGPDGLLPAPPHDATGHTWHHADEVLFRYTTLGGARLIAEQGVSGFESGMPAFGDVLSDTAIIDILAYIKSRWPERERSYQREATVQQEVRR